MIIQINCFEKISYSVKSFKNIEIVPAIYFLFENRQLVYIGKTNLLRQRLFQIYNTKKKWKIDSFGFYPIDLDNLELHKLELENIQHYKPKYNLVGNLPAKIYLRKKIKYPVVNKPLYCII